jgi:hypothetical protein
MIVDHNTIENASEMGLEVSQNSFGRIINNTIRHSGADGILVVGSASAHIGVLRTDDTGPSPNSILENGGDGIRVLRASTARSIGNSLTGNRRSGFQCSRRPTRMWPATRSTETASTVFALPEIRL